MQRKLIGALLLFVSLFFLLGFVYFRNQAALRWISFTGSTLMGALGWAFILMKNGRKQEKPSAYASLDAFMQTAEPIVVNLEECELKSNNYTEEMESGAPSFVKRWDALYDDRRNIKQVQVNQCRLIYRRTTSEGTEVYISGLVYQDETTVRFLLYEKKTTIIYRQPGSGEYYFDIRFLQR